MQACDPVAAMPFRQMHFSKGPAKAFWSDPIFSYWDIITCSYFMFISLCASCPFKICIWSELCLPFPPWNPGFLLKARGRCWGGGQREKWDKHFAPKSPSNLPYKSVRPSPERILKSIWGEKNVQFNHSIPSRASRIFKLSEEHQLFCFHK